MSKYFQIGLVLLYVMLTALGFLIMLELCGVRMMGNLILPVMAGWLGLCFSAAWFRTEIYLLLKAEVRRPVLEEEEKIQRCFREILQTANIDQPFRLLIEEKMEFTAFAIGHNSIVLSRGLVEQMTEAEMKGVLAHELGHLVSKDCIVGSAFATASDLPRLIRYIHRKGKQILLRVFGICLRLSLISGWIALGTLLGMGWLLYKEHLIRPILAVTAYVLVFAQLEKVFLFFWLMISRYTEYKQDAYAHQLGYGNELRQALKKLIGKDPIKVHQYFILMNGTHPVIYHRIRRLEKLAGLR